MTFNRLLTTAAVVSLLAGVAPLAAQAQTATPKTEAAAAAQTGKASTDAPAATAIQGTAKAVSQAAVNAQATAPAKLVASGDMASTLRQSPDFTTFVKALDATNLASLIQTRPGMTVFAPTNAAFAALPPGKLDALMADKAGLQKLLLHHIINAAVPGSKIKGSRGPVPSGAGDPIVLDGSGEPLKADNANIIQADVMASNGTIHVVDQVLIAGSVPATLPEPAAEPTPEPAA
ncbi:MAG: fasciclin domain-containing protein, partial [Phenylobacterium sp.]